MKVYVSKDEVIGAGIDEYYPWNIEDKTGIWSYRSKRDNTKYHNISTRVISIDSNLYRRPEGGEDGQN